MMIVLPLSMSVSPLFMGRMAQYQCLTSKYNPVSVVSMTHILLKHEIAGDLDTRITHSSCATLARET